MPEINFCWWQILQRGLLLLAQEWGLVELVLLTPESQVHVISSSCFMVQLMEQFLWTQFTSYFGKVITEGTSVQFSVTMGKVLPCSPSSGRNCFSDNFADEPRGDLSSGFWTLIIKPEGPWEGTMHHWGHLKFRFIWEKKLSPGVHVFPHLVWVGWRAGQVLVIKVERCTPWIPALFLSPVYQRGRYLLAQKWEGSVAGLQVIVIWVFAWE